MRPVLFPAALLLACGEDNAPPAAATDIPDQAVVEDDTVQVNLRPHFTDPDGDRLTYGSKVSDASVLSTGIAGGTLSLVGLVPGTAKVEVTATDPGGLTASQDFDATVEFKNRAPAITDSIGPLGVLAGDEVSVDLSEHFEDPDGDDISYDAASDNDVVLEVSVELTLLTLRAARPGAANVTVVASDPEGLETSLSFPVTVEGVNRAPELTVEIGDLELEQDEYVLVLLSEHFSDPDGDPLTYAAEAKDTTRASASIRGDTLRVGSGAPGATTLLVTATDLGGLSASGTTVARVDEGFAVDFTELDDLTHWRTENVNDDLDDDGLRISLVFDFCGHSYKRIVSELETWKMEASVGREDEEAASYVTVGIDDGAYQAYRLLVGDGMRADGESVNYRFDYLNANDAWVWLVAGFSDDLDDLGYGVNDVVIEYSESSDTLTASVGDVTLVTLEMDEEGYPTTMTGGAGFGICTLAGEAGDGATALVESGSLEGGGTDSRR